MLEGSQAGGCCGRDESDDERVVDDFVEFGHRKTLKTL